MLCVKGGFEILEVQIRSASDLAQQEWKKTDVAMMNYEQLKYFCMAPQARQKCVSAENKIVWEWFDFWSFGRLTEYAAVVSCASVTQQYPYIGSCIDVWRTCKKCLQKLVLSPTYYWLIASGHAASCYGKSMAMATSMNKVHFVHS